MAFPLNYQVLWKMLCDFGNEALLRSAYETPVQHGLKLMGGDWRLYHQKWVHLGLNAGTDISAFDWCVTYRKMQLVYELRRRLAKGPQVEEWFSLVSRLLEELFVGKKVLYPNGELWCFSWPAVQTSGSPNTIADNSLLRLIDDVVVSLSNGFPVYPLPCTVGDDALVKCGTSEEDVANLIAAYRRRGWVLKCVEFGLDFVGHKFTSQGPVPLYFGKHLCRFAFIQDKIIPEFLEGMARLYAFSPLFKCWEQLASATGVYLLSQDYYKTWYNTEALHAA